MLLSIFHFTFSFFLFPQAHAQNLHRYLYLDDSVYEYLDYQINSGRNIPDFVMQQPFDVSVVASEKTSGSDGYFSDYWQKFYRDKDVSGQFDLVDEVRYQDKVFNRYKAWGGVHFVNEHITLANRTVINQDYKYDPKYAGDLSESDSWIYGRVNDAYVSLKFDGFHAFVGRMHRNWGPVNSSSLILSDNPYTYDHFLFSYTYKIMRISLIVSRLEDLKAYEITKSGGEITEIPNARKYITGHRLDLSFSEKFQIGLTEMAIYGGEGRDFEFAFLNPMNFFYGIQRNDQKPMSGIWNLDIFYKPWSKLTLYSQFLIDDIIVNNDPGVDDRARYPDRFGLMVSARTGDWLMDGLALDATYNRIWNRTYQSKSTYENYHYRELGLGFPAAGLEEFKFKAGFWGWFPLYISNEFTIGRYGEVELTDLFMLNKEPFPIEPVTSNILDTFTVKYFLNNMFRFHATAQYTDHINHYSNRIDQAEGFSAKIGFEILLTGGVDL